MGVTKAGEATLGERSVQAVAVLAAEAAGRVGLEARGAKRVTAAAVGDTEGLEAGRLGLRGLLHGIYSSYGVSDLD
jgi:hypothetical protein